MLLVLCLLACFAMQIWLPAKLANKGDQAPNTDVGQTMLASFARPLKATFHLTISMRDQRATGKIQRNNYRHERYGPSFTGKMSSVSLIFTHGTHRNVRNRLTEK